jgi:hypothetical protein
LRDAYYAVYQRNSPLRRALTQGKRSNYDSLRAQKRMFKLGITKLPSKVRWYIGSLVNSSWQNVRDILYHISDKPRGLTGTSGDSLLDCTSCVDDGDYVSHDSYAFCMHCNIPYREMCVLNGCTLPELRRRKVVSVITPVTNSQTATSRFDMPKGHVPMNRFDEDLDELEHQRVWVEPPPRRSISHGFKSYLTRAQAELENPKDLVLLDTDVRVAVDSPVDFMSSTLVFHQHWGTRRFLVFPLTDLQKAAYAKQDKTTRRAYKRLASLSEVWFQFKFGLQGVKDPNTWRPRDETGKVTAMFGYSVSYLPQIKYRLPDGKMITCDIRNSNDMLLAFCSYVRGGEIVFPDTILPGPQWELDY